jgi:hypothetical protein
MVSSSGPLHCSDGWSYLARALSALIAGDGHAARHLAYYAELRAALSILACDGVGVFDNRNCVVDINGDIHPLTERGTHDIVWAALSAWAGQQNAFGRIATAIEIGGVSLIDALQAFFPGSAGAALGSKLIEAWGFDLNLSASDRHQRNYSSYVATHLNPLPGAPRDDLEFISSIWRSFEPSSWDLERHLLRHTLELEISTLNGAPIGDRRPSYDASDPRLTRIVSFEFLSRASEMTDHPLLSTAADQTSHGPRPMLARAALLLRVATSMVRANLNGAGLNGFVDLASWWTSVGIDRGFWSVASQPQDLTELWLEIEDALADALSADTSDRRTMIASLDLAAARLSQTDRVPLWALCA